MESNKRKVGIYEFVLTDANDLFSPPEQPVLRVSLCGDNLVSLSIEKYHEEFDRSSYEVVASIIVDAEPLFNGLNASWISDGVKDK